jgi:transglutaminase-like putative cysteine protease
MMDRARESALEQPASTDRWWDILAALILLGALTTAASRLYVTEWIEDLGMTQTVVFLGLLVGLALGQSRFSRRWVIVLALGYSVVLVFWQMGLTIHGDVPWMTRLAKLSGRLIFAIVKTFQQQPVRDPLLFLFLMLSLFWGLSLHSGYTFARHGQPWRATLPTGLAILIIHWYDRFVANRVWILGIYLFLSLLLVARAFYLRHRQRWEKARIQMPPYVGMDFARIALPIIVLVVLFSWTIPAVAEALPAAQQTWRKVIQPWYSVRDRLSNAFASLSGPVAAETYEYYGSYLPLGFGVDLTDAVLMTVEAPPRPPGSPPYYWRARVYDSYGSRGWNSTFSVTQLITSTIPVLGDIELEGRRTVSFTFQSAIPIATIYAAPQPIGVSHPVYVDLTLNPDDTVDLSAIHATPPLRADSIYRVQSVLSNVTVAQLREAGADYPQWVTDRYLSLPDSVSARTRELAIELSQGQETPYDVAETITQYLREAITYNATLSENPPSGQDPIDWFLFEQREGFCNYYASAEVIMLRSLGIPARLSAGFAQGDRNAGSNIYTVRQLHNHAWPEVYFPGLGWIEFEPTVSQPPIVRPTGSDETETDEGDRDAIDVQEGRDRLEDRLEELLGIGEEATPEEPATVPDQGPGATPLIVVGILGVGIGVLVWRVRRRQGMPPLPTLLENGFRRFGLEPPRVLNRWSRRTVLQPLERAYLELNRSLRLMGSAPASSDTPAERAAALARLIPETLIPGRRLLEQYHATAYGREPGDPFIAQHAGRRIRQATARALIQRYTPDRLKRMR